jgi:hypothetical protein
MKLLLVVVVGCQQQRLLLPYQRESDPQQCATWVLTWHKMTAM